MCVRVGYCALSATGWELSVDEGFCRDAVSASAVAKAILLRQMSRKEFFMVKNNTKRLALDAMLAAMYVVLSMVSIQLPAMKITFDSLPILVGAALFGPIDGLAIGLVGSFINQCFSQYGLTATTILWILPAGVRGLMVGSYSKRHSYSMTTPQTIFITVLSALVVTVLNTLVMYVDSWVYQYAYAAVLITVIIRIIVGIATAVVFSFILPALLKPLRAFLHQKV